MIVQSSGSAAAKTLPLTQQSSQSDQLVISAWSSRRLSDGSRLNLGLTDREQGFVVRNDGIFPVSFRQSGIQTCDNGTSQLANKLNASDIRPNAGGHTHPRGRSDSISPLPGPEDGQMATVTGKTAYVISSRGAFAIDRTADGYEVRLLAGRAISPSEQGEISRNIAQWNANNGSSGVRCTFTPN